MTRSGLIGCLASTVVLAACNAIAGALAPKITSVQVGVPPGMLVGDSAVATSNANGDDGRTHNGRPVTWRSSDPAALPIDAQGKMVAKIAGRTVTISAEVDGTTGSAAVKIGADDNRIGYTLADQPTAPGPYSPDPATSFNSSNGTISVTRASVGVYTMRFAGLGRPPGGRDNVQVSGFSTSAVYCKPQMWDAAGADMVVPVGCFNNDGSPADSKFTILVIGARVFGATTPLGFSVAPATANTFLDSSVTAKNSTGGQIGFGYNSVGNYSEIFFGLGPASGGTAGPVGLLISPVGPGPQRCGILATDLNMGGLGIGCEGPQGGLADSPYSVLWLTRGRAGFRWGYALPNNPGAINPYAPSPEYRSSSSGGPITSRQTATGKYQVVFGGLARSPGGTETVLVSESGGHGFCNVSSWANSGTSDLSVNVGCYDPMGRPNNANGLFNILVIQ